MATSCGTQVHRNATTAFANRRDRIKGQIGYQQCLGTITPYQPVRWDLNDPSVGSWPKYLRPMPKRIVIASDHAGFDLKQKLLDHLVSKGIAVLDLGTDGPGSVDYPDQAHRLAEEVAQGRQDLGLLLCGSGNGVNIVANKHRGVRSALAWLPEVASLARAHNDANVLAVPARFVSEEEAKRIVDAFLGSMFEGGRHQRRVEKIEQ